MKRVRWMVVMLGLLCVSLTSIVPATDDPETAFNETDTPINLIAPANSLTNFAAPAGDSVVISEKQQTWRNSDTIMRVVKMKSGMRPSHSLLNLLCKLLC